MRPFLPALLFLTASVTATASAAELPVWEPNSTEVVPLSFVSDATLNTYNLSLAFPALLKWDSLTMDVFLSADVFGPLSGTSISSGYSDSAFGGIGVVDFGSSTAHFDTNRPGEALHQFQVTLSLPPTGIDIPAGALVLTMALDVKPNLGPLALGPRQIFTDIEYTTFSDELSSSAIIYANISAVPEPQTWATMLVGLTLIGSAVARNRRKPAIGAV